MEDHAPLANDGSRHRCNPWPSPDAVRRRPLGRTSLRTKRAHRAREPSPRLGRSVLGTPCQIGIGDDSARNAGRHLSRGRRGVARQDLTHALGSNERHRPAVAARAATWRSRNSRSRQQTEGRRNQLRQRRLLEAAERSPEVRGPIRKTEAYLVSQSGLLRSSGSKPHQCQGQSARTSGSPSWISARSSEIGAHPRSRQTCVRTSRSTPDTNRYPPGFTS